MHVIDDHSRVCVAATAFRVAKAHDVVKTFHHAAATWGYPASVLSDNGAVFTAAYRNGIGALESELCALGIAFKHSRPYHPQTCGKVERFHQTVKKFLARQHPPTTIRGLQAQLDGFADYYNSVRPHRSIGRRTPIDAFHARTKAHPRLRGVTVDGYRLRHDTIDDSGKITIRYQSRLYHIGLGRRHAGRPSPCSSPDATFVSSPKTASSSASSSSTPPATTSPNSPDVYDHPRHQSPMSRDITALR